jgi:hypothetical protein
MIKLKDILLELDTDPKKVFGDIVFGDKKHNKFYNKIVNLQGKTGSEQNTKDEEIILKILLKWVGSNNKKVVNNLYSYEDLFKNAAKVFPSIFKPTTPDGTTIYRGIRVVNEKTILKLKKTSPKDWKKIKFGSIQYVKCMKPIQYTPHLEIQSWTTSKTVAHEFGSKLSSKDGVWGYNGGILISKQNDEYLFNQKVMNLLFGESKEDEILHFGNKYSEEVFIAIPETSYNGLVSK